MEQGVVLITQARTGSSRLPGKVLKTIGGRELLKIHLERISKAKEVDQIIVATTDNPSDDQLTALVKEWGYIYYRGSEQDVLDRFYQAVLSLPEPPEWVVRVTSDCPLLDSALIDEVIGKTISANVDYGANILKEAFPDGQDIEVFRYAALEKAWKEAQMNSEREHVTPFIRKNSDFFNGGMFTAINHSPEHDYSNLRMTVDEPKDFLVIESLISQLGEDATWQEYAECMLAKDLMKINSEHKRNEGYFKSLKEDK